MPKFWNGMTVSAWLRLLVKNRFRLGWQYWYMVPAVTAYGLLHSLTRIEQWLLAGHRIRSRLDHPPLFVLGHWRTGTTLLHELLVLDQRHTSPNTYECFAPAHFMLTEGTGVPLLSFLVPSRRPMDNMPAGWRRPQEDEFALCNLGLPSPYLTIAFPNEPPQDPEYLTLEDVPPDDLRRWKRTFLRFLVEVECMARRRKRVVLKSPPHTARVKVLLEMFPDAKFVHIVRDPFVVFPSTVHLWKTLYARQGLQKPTFDGLEDYVFDNLDRMYARFEQDRALIPAGNLTELRYEDLVADPLGAMRRVYEELNLGGFDAVRPALETFLDGARGYETNRYAELSQDLRRRIGERWRSYAETYGYTPVETD
ncbi:MAG: sulfotransferase [Rhizobiaceae bacterium]